MEERRTITALFADLRGLAPASHTIVDRLGTVIEDEHGVVARVDEHGMLAIFGPLPFDEHVAVAARAALAVRALVDHDGGERRGRLGLGLNTGAVVTDRLGRASDSTEAVAGHAVTVASRLGESAAPGQILLGPGTAALLSSEFDVRDRGTIELADTGPTAVFELVR